MRLKPFVATIALAAACAFSPPAQSQPPKKEFVDAFLTAFRHFLAVTSAGVDECGNRFPEKKDGYRAEFERVRIGNLDVIVHAELSEGFDEFLRVERAYAAAETEQVMAEYCAELPRFIGVMDEYASQLRRALNPRAE